MSFCIEKCRLWYRHRKCLALSWTFSILFSFFILKLWHFPKSTWLSVFFHNLNSLYVAFSFPFCKCYKSLYLLVVDLKNRISLGSYILYLFFLYIDLTGTYLSTLFQGEFLVRDKHFHLVIANMPYISQVRHHLMPNY